VSLEERRTNDSNISQTLTSLSAPREGERKKKSGPRKGSGPVAPPARKGKSKSAGKAGIQHYAPILRTQKKRKERKRSLALSGSFVQLHLTGNKYWQNPQGGKGGGEKEKKGSVRYSPRGTAGEMEKKIGPDA